MVTHEEMNTLFHKASYQIEKIALEEDIDTIIIGQNKDWKQNMNMGKKNNQSFTTIPHNLLIHMITYKAERHGIKVEVTDFFHYRLCRSYKRFYYYTKT